MGLLLEREPELAQLERTLELAAAGDGRGVLIAGPAGAGKTTLLSAAIDLARAREISVVGARGGELEGDLPLGVVRQLFEPLISGADPRRREQMLAGAAQLCAAVFVGGTDRGGGAGGEAMVHGLFWLVSNLAAEGPLVVAIDDAHWADSASLRFVSYLARRLEALPVVLLVCSRSDEPVAEGTELAKVLTAPELERIEPQPLSEAAIGEIVAAELGSAPDVSFVAACRWATGGTPYLVHALVADLRASGVAPTAGSAGRIGEIGPRAVGHATMLRLARLHPAATKLARAVAVLGRQAHLPRIAKLAEVAPDDALAGLDALVAGRVVDVGPPMGFVHPILRTAVYGGLAVGERSLAHSRAADLLAAEGLADDAVAMHLLATEPCGRPDLVERMRTAARDAQARGAPETAAVYLRRALAEEPVRELRAGLLYELGLAESMVRRADCLEHLDAARQLLDDPEARARCVLETGNALTWMGRPDEAFAVLQAGLDDVGADGEAAVQLATTIVNHGIYFPARAHRVDELLERLRVAAARGDAPSETLLVLAMVDVMHGDNVDAAIAMVERGLGGGRLLAEQGAGSDALIAALVALAFADELDRAEALLDAMADDARRRGLVSAFVVTRGLRECVFWRRGDVDGAEDQLRHVFALVREHELMLPTVFTLYYAVDVLTERDGPPGIADLAMTLELPPAHRATQAAAWLAEVRANLLLARGERRAAVAALEPCEGIYAALRMQPSVSPWRSLLATACAPDDPDRALGLVRFELEDARTVGRPRAIGIALRRLGLIEGGKAGIEHLREAEEVLALSTARLEHARALVELGAALRRANARAAARDPLRAGLDLAHRCGATRLAERAHTELAATGARPRRMMITGRDALTPTERRIATMAAEGQRNAQIAQALFVTTKTVENQLSRVYKKLAVSGREQLAGALDN